MSYIEYKVHDRIAFITLNRPDKLNALTDEMVVDLRQALFRFDDDEDAHVAILSGEGRSFCSGADVRQRRLRSQEELRRLGEAQGRGARIQELMHGLTNWKPIVAAVQGHVLGAGLYIALLCEMMVAAEDAQFQITETALGTDPTMFWSLLRDRAGSGFATDVAVTGRYWSGEEAVRVRAADRLAANGDHVHAAIELVQNEILPMAPLSVRAMVDVRRGALEEIVLSSYLRRPRGLHLTADFRESALAFVEKRKPVFRGR